MDELFPCKQLPTTNKYRDEYDKIFRKKEDTVEDEQLQEVIEREQTNEK